MKDLIIVCENAFGLDVKRIIVAINEAKRNNGEDEPYRIWGFMGYGDVPLEKQRYLQPYLGAVEDWQQDSDVNFVMAIVDPRHKKACAALLKSRGARFETLIASWTLVHSDMEFPEGCIIAAHSVMDSAKIGAFATLFHSMVGFDAVVGDYTSIMARANITTSHIGNEVYIGPNCAVMSGSTIYDGATVMPNSVVVKDIKAGMIVFGVPARRIKASKQ